MVEDGILVAREKRREKIKEKAKDSDVVTVKANVVGFFKNIPEALAVVYYFAREIEKMGAYDMCYYDSADGLTVLFRVADGVKFKNLAMDLEKKHPLGRLVDIDVTLKGEEKSLSRNELRKCFLCDNPAFVCGRNKSHSTAELLGFFTSKCQEYFGKMISQIIEESMLSELNIENKFGLVTPTSNGSHSDLDYGVMQSAIYAINKTLSKAFYLGLTTDFSDGLLDKLKEVGIECQEKMFSITKGANAYKGFIFIGGIILAWFGKTLKEGYSESSLADFLKRFCAEFNFPVNTFGAKAYLNGIGGVRKCAESGFKIIEQAEKLMENLQLPEILTYIVGQIDDSVLYKRAGGMERYNYFKNLISTAPNDQKIRQKITKECIDNNISIGGSADILISAVMLNKLKNTFCFKVKI